MMKDQDNPSRRRFLAGSAAAATAAVISKDASAQDADFVIDPPDVISMEVVGTDERFPIRRVFCGFCVPAPPSSCCRIRTSRAEFCRASRSVTLHMPPVCL